MTGRWLVSAPRLCGQPVLTPRGNCVGGQGLLPPPQAVRPAVCYPGITLRKARGAAACSPQGGVFCLPGNHLVRGRRVALPPLCRAAIRVTPRDHRVGGRVSVSADRGCCHPRLRDPLVLVRWFWSLGTTYWKHSRAAAPWPQGGVFCSPRNRLDCGRRVAVPRPRCAAIGV